MRLELIVVFGLLAALAPRAAVGQSPALTVSDAEVSEIGDAEGVATFVVELVGAPTEVVTVDWATVDLTAVGGADYTPAAGHLELHPAGPRRAAVSVPIRVDAEPEPAEEFFVRLYGAVNAVVAKANGHGVILDDDGFTAAAPKCDLDGRGRSDLVVGLGGTTATDGSDLIHVDKHEPWGVGSTLAAPQGAVSTYPWDVVATHDFDGDGRCDLAWVDGERHLAITSSRQDARVVRRPAATDIVDTAPSGWFVVGSGRLGHASADLFWWDEASRTLEVWRSEWLEGRVTFPARQRLALPGEPDPAWQPVATADLDGDGAPELLWQHATAAQIRYWRRAWRSPDEAVEIGAPVPAGPVDANWQVRAAGDFDGNGIDDLLFQNAQSEKLVVWLLGPGGVRMAGSFLSPERLVLPDEDGIAPDHEGIWIVRGPK